MELRGLIAAHLLVSINVDTTLRGFFLLDTKDVFSLVTWTAVDQVCYAKFIRLLLQTLRAQISRLLGFIAGA